MDTPANASPQPLSRYIVVLKQPDGDTFYSDGNVNERDRDKATRFNSYRDALLRMTAATEIWRLDDPATITVQPAPECMVRQTWTAEEILRQEG
jgi:hypothetical protein